MAVKFSNNAKTTISGSLTTSATSIGVADASNFPTLGAGDYTYATIAEAATPANFEIVKVTGISSNTLTIVRAQQGTSARSFSTNDLCELRVTSGLMEEAIDEKADLADLSVTTASAGTAALSYNNTSGVFTFTPPDLSSYLTSLAINDISDVTITTPADNEVLAYDSTSSEFINQTASEAGLATSAQGSLADSALQPADLSVTTNAAGTAALTYTSGTGVFSYTPPDLSSYLTSYTETDPVVGAITGIVKADGAGNISAAVPGTDYLSSYTETDTLDSVTGRGATTANAVTVGNLTSTGIDDNATSTAITIDASQNVGIGVSTVSHKLQLPQVSGTSLSFSNDTSFTLDGESVAYYGLTYTQPTGKYNMVLSAFSDLIFATNAIERMRIGSSGSVSITSADINGGTIDGTTIGGTTPDKGTFIGASDYDAGVVIRSGGSTTASWSRLNITNQNDTGGGVGIVYMDGAGTFAFRNDTGTNQIMSFLFGAAEEFRMTSAGNFHADGDVIAYSTTISDENLKDGVETIDSALDKVSNLRGVTYTWNAGSREGKRDLGVIAQEVETVIPEIVHEHEMPLLDGETYKTVDYEKLTAVLIEAVKELKSEVDALKAAQ